MLPTVNKLLIIIIIIQKAEIVRTGGISIDCKRKCHSEMNRQLQLSNLLLFKIPPTRKTQLTGDWPQNKSIQKTLLSGNQPVGCAVIR